MHAAYLSFYPILAAAPLGLWFSGRRSGLARRGLRDDEHLLRVLRDLLLLPGRGAALLASRWRRTRRRPCRSPSSATACSSGGSAWGTAFPSSHVAAALVAAVCAWRGWRPLGAVLLVAACAADARDRLLPVPLRDRRPRRCRRRRARAERAPRAPSGRARSGGVNRPARSGYPEAHGLRAHPRDQGAAAAEGHERARHDLRRRHPLAHRPRLGGRGAQDGAAALRDQGHARGRVPRAGLPRGHRELLHGDRPRSGAARSRSASRSRRSAGARATASTSR